MAEKDSKQSQAPRALQVSAPSELKPFETNLQRREKIVIGRGTECDVVIQDLKASRRHCQLTRKQDGFLLEDLGSKNGTYVNGERITEPMVLTSTNTFKIGDTVFYLT